MYAMAVAMAADPILQDDSSSASSQAETVPSEAKANTTKMPPRMARKKQVAADRIDEISQNPARAKKELARLNALISKLTASTDHVKPKVLYLDEKQLALRWGMSVKHVRNLRAAGVGPRVTYFGRSVRYRLRDVVAFEKANAFASRTDKEQSG